MAAVGITHITVRYRISGQETLLQDAAQLIQTESDIQSAQSRQQQAQQALITLNQPTAPEIPPAVDQLPVLNVMGVPERIGQCWRGMFALPEKTAALVS